jgi:microcystin-dependent protein
MAKRFQQGSLVTEASPVGTVKAYAGGTAPSGWLLCDGTNYSRTTYAALFALIGTTYDTQINETSGSPFIAPASTDFRVPDYRGLFLRGVGSPSGLDAVTLGGRQTGKTKTPIAAFTTAASGTAAVTNSGTLTGHNHALSTLFLSYGASNPSGASNYASGTQQFQRASNTDNSNIDHSHSVSTTGSVNGGGDNETRPLNKGVNYIIKF